MAALRLRDRDTIITQEGLSFRVLGYSHPTNAYICNAEYAPAEVFESNNPKAFRSKGQHVFYKFYEDEGWKFIQHSFPQHTVFHQMLHKKVLGVSQSNIAKTRKPDEELTRLIEIRQKDELIKALQTVLEITTQSSDLSTKSFGVFGSMLHGFHHPRFSDIDLVIYGRKNAARLFETLQQLYKKHSSLLRNEFGTEESVKGKHWKFLNYSLEAYIWHQRRKIAYALFNDENSGRVTKTEFEPVKDWNEISNAYDPKATVKQIGWTKMLARVVDDQDALFIPSIYGIEPLKVLSGTRSALKARRIISYIEEFRMQAHKDETIYVEGNLEEVMTSKGKLHQITLTYCPRYYKQVLQVNS